MVKKIRKLTIEGFRGVATRTTLDFANTAEAKPSSCLLIGENGSGKSTFVDALEFCLSGRYFKPSGRSKLDLIRRLSNLATDNPGVVEVEFDDGSRFVRTLYSDDEGTWRIDPEEPYEPFRGSGFALRREDIVGVLAALPAQRRSMFSAFMRSASASATPPSELMVEIEQLGASRVDADARRVQEAKKLARLMKMSPKRVLNQTQTVSQFSAWLQSVGYIRNQLERKQGGLTKEERAIFRQAAQVKSAIKAYVDISAKVANKRRQLTAAPMTAVLNEVGLSLSDSFLTISPSASDIDGVELSLSDGTAVDLFVRFPEGRKVLAEDYFSEANLDLLALLLFLALLKYAGKNGQPKIVALDDVLQSVDASVRLKVAKYLLNEFGDWQFLVTFHDRLWKEQFAATFSSKHTFVEREIKGWALDSGPTLIQLRRDASADLREALSSSESRNICGAAGYLLELMSDWLSKYLQTSVTRRHGDKYTLADTWSGVSKALRATSIKDMAERVDQYMFLRNLHGAHYNEWATELSIEDAAAFGNAVLQLWDNIWCGKCREPIGKFGNIYHCRCGSMMLNSGLSTSADPRPQSAQKCGG